MPFEWQLSRLTRTRAPFDRQVCLPAANEYYGKEWAAHQGCHRMEVPYMHRVATCIAAILQHNPLWEDSCPDHAWHSVQDTAFKVSITLQWLVGTGHLESKPNRPLLPSELQLVQVLWHVLHGMLNGHMMDQSLDMERTPADVLMSATPCLSQPSLQSAQPLADLVCAALKRIATDEALYKFDRSCESQEAALQPFLIFWVFLGEAHWLCNPTALCFCMGAWSALATQHYIMHAVSLHEVHLAVCD